MSSAEAFYRFLLRAYPADFRSRYAREMTIHFRDVRRDATGRSAGFWLGILWDVAKSAPLIRMQRMHAWWNGYHDSGDIAMPVMGMLSMLVGAVLLVTSIVEIRYGATGSDPDVMYPLLKRLSGATAGMLLTSVGWDLLRRKPHAIKGVPSVTPVCLMAFATLGASPRIFPVFATVLGIGFPIILLAFWYWRRRGSSRPPVA